MKLSTAAFGLTLGLIWGGAILVIGGIALFVPGYGEAVLAMTASVYPGYEHSGTFGDLVVGSTFAFFDGLAGGIVFAWLYNALSTLANRRRNADRQAVAVGDDGESES